MGFNSVFKGLIEVTEVREYNRAYSGN